MPKVEKEMGEMIVFKAPRELKQKLEAYCKLNGYNISYAVRKALEAEIVHPELPMQGELWKDMLQWRNDINKILKELIDTQNEFYQIYKEDLKRLIDLAERNLKVHEHTTQYLEKVDSKIKSLEFLNQVMLRILEKITNLPIREIISEELKAEVEKQKKERIEHEKTER